MKRIKWDPMTRPKRDKLAGFSYSEFKTMLKRRGHKVHRDLNQRSFITEYRNRKHRFRHWGSVYPTDDKFVVDIACVNRDFDRWANSTDRTITIEEFLND